MELEVEVLERVGTWQSLSRWEKSELGKDLRRLGLSYGEIMELVEVNKSTLATWCRDVKLSTEQIEAMKKRRAQEPGIPVDTQWKRRKEVELIRAQATLEAEHLVDESLWVAGVAMYWGEGTKVGSQLTMANSDPAVLRMFKAWSIKYLGPNMGWRAKLNIHANNDEPGSRQWWAAQLDIPLNDFTKTYIKPDGTGHRTNHLPYGVCQVTKRKSSNGYHTAMAWIEFLQVNLGN